MMRHGDNRGFGMLELMVAGVLSSILAIFIAHFFSSSKRAVQQASVKDETSELRRYIRDVVDCSATMNQAAAAASCAAGASHPSGIYIPLLGKVVPGEPNPTVALASANGSPVLDMWNVRAQCWGGRLYIERSRRVGTQLASVGAPTLTTNTDWAALFTADNSEVVCSLPGAGHDPVKGWIWVNDYGAGPNFTIPSDELTVIAWSSANATSCTLSSNHPGQLPTLTAEPMNPGVVLPAAIPTSVFTLTCTGKDNVPIPVWQTTVN